MKNIEESIFVLEKKLLWILFLVPYLLSQNLSSSLYRCWENRNPWLICVRIIEPKLHVNLQGHQCWRIQWTLQRHTCQSWGGRHLWTEVETSTPRRQVLQSTPESCADPVFGKNQRPQRCPTSHPLLTWTKPPNSGLLTMVNNPEFGWQSWIRD